MTTWAGLDDLKKDMGIDSDDTRDDAQLAQVLDAAMQLVQRVRPDINYTFDAFSDLPTPSYDLILGTYRLAGRLHTRRRSPDGLVATAEFGNSRIPQFDSDIERLLGVGRYRGP